MIKNSVIYLMEFSATLDPQFMAEYFAMFEKSCDQFSVSDHESIIFSGKLNGDIENGDSSKSK